MNDKEVASTNKIRYEKYGLAIALWFEAKLEVMHVLLLEMVYINILQSGWKTRPNVRNGRVCVSIRKYVNSFC
jgi:hypothetical protein